MSTRRIYLPSNGSFDCFPQNQPSMYTNNCPSTYLDVDKQWQCALSEIQFPNVYNNVRDGRNVFVILAVDKHEVKKPYNCKIKTGSYHSIPEIVAEMRKAVVRSFKKKWVVTFTFIKVKSAVRVLLSKGYNIIFKGDIATLLGFEPNYEHWGNILLNTTIESKFLANIHGGCSNVYIYTDIIQEQQIENQQKQLLRVADWAHRVKDETVIKIFDRPYFCNLKNTRFDTITIQIADDMGVPIDFIGGKTLAVLEFKSL